MPLDFSSPCRGDRFAIAYGLGKAAAGILIWSVGAAGLNYLVQQVEPPAGANADPFSFLGILTLDSLLLLLSIFYAVVGWRKKTLQLKETAVWVASGVLTSNFAQIPFSSLQRLEYSEKRLYRLFGVIRVTFGNQPKDPAQTDPGAVRQEFSFFFKKEDGLALYRRLRSEMPNT